MDYEEMMKTATERHFKFYILSQGVLNKMKPLCLLNPQFKIIYDKTLSIINTDNKLYKCSMALLKAINGVKEETVIDTYGPKITKSYNDYISAVDLATQETQKILSILKIIEEVNGNENN